jgi:hypothetical protein
MAKTSVKYPTHAFPNAHAFRSEKRRHLRALRKALGQLRTGCAYFPDGGESVALMIDRTVLLAQQLSVKEWGR